MATSTPRPGQQLVAPRVGLQLFKQLLTPTVPSTHLLTFGLLVGAQAWHGFIGGPIAFKTLPKQTFGHLQDKLFKVYFPLTTGLSAVLLATFTYANPYVRANYTSLSHPVVYQAFTLLTSTVAHAVNWFYLGPEATKVMYRRHRLERAEGKDSRDANVSAQMKQLNKEFGTLHSISSLLNLAAFGGVLFHGLWLAQYGLQYHGL